MILCNDSIADDDGELVQRQHDGDKKSLASSQLAGPDLGRKFVFHFSKSQETNGAWSACRSARPTVVVIGARGSEE
jgi:hypothetical protein